MWTAVSRRYCITLLVVGQVGCDCTTPGNGALRLFSVELNVAAK